jgi:hypothetical protein
LRHSVESFKALLKTAPAVKIRARLSRLVPQLDLGPLPDWLFTSGKPNRYNPAGVDCVYFGESRDVAQGEYDNFWKGLRAADQPVTIYHACVNLRRVLDLASGGTLRSLRLTRKDLLANWRRSRRMIVTQLLGQAINETRLFSAIRYPSKAAAIEGKPGLNIVIFRHCVRAPDSVQILGPKSTPLQKWP